MKAISVPRNCHTGIFINCTDRKTKCLNLITCVFLGQCKMGSRGESEDLFPIRPSWKAEALKLIPSALQIYTYILTFWADPCPEPLGVRGQHVLLPQICRERKLPQLCAALRAGVGVGAEKPLCCTAGRMLCPCQGGRWGFSTRLVMVSNLSAVRTEEGDSLQLYILAEMRFEEKQLLLFGASKKYMHFILPTDNASHFNGCEQLAVCGEVVNSLLRARWLNLLGCDQPCGIFPWSWESPALCSYSLQNSLPACSFIKHPYPKRVHSIRKGKGTGKGHGSQAAKIIQFLKEVRPEPAGSGRANSAGALGWETFAVEVCMN